MKRFLIFLSLFSFFSVYAQNEVSLVSWNIRDFGKTKSPETITKIAAIVKNYDIVALQEVVAGYGGAQAVAKLADELNRKGAKWDYTISNPTKSPPYKTERYAFLWKTSKIKTRGRGKLLSSLENKIYREPFIMTFIKDSKEFSVLNYHSRKHNDKPEEEIESLVRYVLLQKTPTFLVGDFNITQDHIVFSPLYQSGYKTAIHNKKTTLKRKCKKENYRNYAIDNIFFNKKFTHIISSQVIDFVTNCNNLETARKISDHLPVGVVFELN